ncbi:MAG: FRG domain-containing protein [Planctomycetota bacterium]
MAQRGSAISKQWDELRKELTDLADTGEWAFRGEREPYPSVHPAIDRITLAQTNTLALSQLLSIEREATAEFFKHAAGSASGIEAAMFADWLSMQALLRHYGGPTRLLDWSTDWRVSAFWACESEFEKDGRIMAFNFKSLKTQQMGLVGTSDDFWRTPVSFNKGMPVPRILHVQSVRQMPKAVFIVSPELQFPRIIVQRGVFSIATQPQLDHWETIQNNNSDPNHTKLFVVPAGVKRFALQRLSRQQISHASILPGVTGAALHASAIAERRATDRKAYSANQADDN